MMLKRRLSLTKRTCALSSPTPMCVAPSFRLRGFGRLVTGVFGESTPLMPAFTLQTGCDTVGGKYSA